MMFQFFSYFKPQRIEKGNEYLAKKSQQLLLFWTVKVVGKNTAACTLRE